MLEGFRFPLQSGQQWPATEGGRQLPFFNWLRVHVRGGSDVLCSWSGQIPSIGDDQSYDERFEANSRRTRKLATLKEADSEGGWPHSLNFRNLGPAAVVVDVTISDESIVDLSSGGAAQLQAGLPVSAANPVPVSLAEQAATAGNITGTGQVVGPVPVALDGTVTVSISGVYAGVSGVFEISDDGGATWFLVQGARTESFAAETGPTALTNANRAWDVPVIGVTHFRFRSTAWTSGTAAIRITPTGGYVEPSPSVGAYGTIASNTPSSSEGRVVLALQRGAGAGASLDPWQSITGAADGMVSNVALAAGFLFSGGGFDRARTPGVFKSIAAVAVVAGTPVAVWTPTAGKKFRLMGFVLGLSVAGSVILKDAGAEIARALVAAGQSLSAPAMGNGILSAAANNALQIDASASGSVSGFVYGTEE